MPYCCVPRCKSSSKQRTPGISFYEIPSNPELRAKWRKVYRRLAYARGALPVDDASLSYLTS
ncbi:hypothetical protein HPB52_008795 [Rhipicephalus sanguineus]|uniref:THAP-type domain-containing protein n=1 Tax=Rhipicephalus sanguineus TaxID=34632 RepID=A0A9D4SYI3_RHISA|nr:hypothetical protein HPB52_008795 [Rhipicephalus sanguineus]